MQETSDRMSWLPELAPPERGWEQLEAMFPEMFSALIGVQAACWDHVDPVVLELCRLRMATLLGSRRDLELRSSHVSADDVEAKIDQLAHHPDSPLFTSAERACIALAEQFVIDIQGLTDEHVAAVVAEIGDEACYALVQALWSFEAMQRACLVLGVAPTPATIGSDTSGGH